jgi:hypothetical protein
MTHLSDAISNQVARHPGGRPSRYTPDIGERIADAMATGLSLDAAAAARRIGPRTAFTWQNQHEEFRQAVEDGRARALLFWERRAISLANGEAGNAAIVALGLKNRSRAASGWHDAQRLEHSGPGGGPVQMQAVTIDASTLSVEHRNALKAALLEVKRAATKE